MQMGNGKPAWIPASSSADAQRPIVSTARHKPTLVTFPLPSTSQVPFSAEPSRKGGRGAPNCKSSRILNVFECHLARINARASGGAQANANISHCGIGYALCYGVFAVATLRSNASFNLG